MYVGIESTYLLSVKRLSVVTISNCSESPDPTLEYNLNHIDIELNLALIICDYLYSESLIFLLHKSNVTPHTFVLYFMNYK